MSILKRSASPQAPAAEWRPHGDRLRVITAGRVGNMEDRLGTSGFDVVAVAETEDALIDAVSADEPDAIVVEADLCASLEHVRDLAPDAVLIVVGNHTPAGALGRIEPGVSGTAMAGLLHALVAEGVGAAVVWGLVPGFGPRAAHHVPLRMVGSLLSAKADLVRAHFANALRDHAEIVAAASTVAVTVSASLLLTLSAARPHDRPERVPIPAPAVERAPQDPVVAVSPTTRTPAHGPSANEGEPGDRREPNRGESRDHGRHDHPPSNASRPPGVANGWDHRPPKHADNGHHKGWSSNSVPEDLPPGKHERGRSETSDDRTSVAFGNAPFGPREGRGTDLAHRTGPEQLTSVSGANAACHLAIAGRLIQVDAHGLSTVTIPHARIGVCSGGITAADSRTAGLEAPAWVADERELPGSQAQVGSGERRFRRP